MTTQFNRKPYPSDLTDAQWELLAPFIPAPAADSPREPIDRREIVNGIQYMLRTGCSWRQMPHDLPNGKTVYHYFRKWTLDGTWEKAMSSLRKEVRTQMGRDPEPSAAIIDSQSIKTSPVRSVERGYDAGKKKSGGANAPWWLIPWACYWLLSFWLPMWGIGKEPNAYWSHAPGRIFPGLN